MVGDVDKYLEVCSSADKSEKSCDFSQQILISGLALLDNTKQELDCKTIETVVMALLKHAEISSNVTAVIISSTERALTIREAKLNGEKLWNTSLNSYHIRICKRTIRKLLFCRGFINDEELMRTLWNQLIIPSNVLEMYMDLVREGSIKDACLISRDMTDLCKFQSPMQLYELIKSAPRDVAPEDLTNWIRTDVAPYLFEILSATAPPTDVAQKIVVSVKIAKYISQWAKDYEDCDRNPFRAIHVVNCASSIVKVALGIHESVPSWPEPKFESIKWSNSFICIADEELKAFLTQSASTILSTELYLRIQKDVWLLWDKKLSLAMIEDRGIQGILFGQLWDIPFDQFSNVLNTMVFPILDIFQIPIDVMLEEWIRDALSTRVITCIEVDATHQNATKNELEGDLGRLIHAAKAITSPSIRANIILLLLQVPIVISPTLDPNDSFERTSMPSEENVGAAKSLLKHKFCVDDLCLTARSLCGEVEATARESLIEALRLQRIKSLAYSYGVDDLDPRNYRQIRQVAGLIACRVTSPTSIPDAVEIVHAWSSGDFDITGLLSRALVHRATNDFTDRSDDQAQQRNLYLESALKSIPSRRLKVTVETTINCLLDMIQTVSDEASRIDKSTADSSTNSKIIMIRLNCQYFILIQSTIFILSWYLDEFKSMSQKLRNGDTDVNSCSDSWQSSLKRKSTTKTAMTHDWSFTDIEELYFPLTNVMLFNLKRMRQLYSESDVMLSVQDLQVSDKCKLIASKLAEIRTGEIINMYETSKNLGATAYVDRTITPNNRRACGVLNVSVLYFNHKILKSLFKNNQKELVMNFANCLSQSNNNTNIDEGELFDSMPYSNKSLQTASMDDEESTLLIDAAMTLSSMAAKQAFESSASNDRNSGNGSITGITVFKKMFSYSRALLQSTLLLCSLKYLTQTIDLLQSVDLALTVFSRIEGNFSQELSSLSQTQTDTKFRVLENVFSRDGILMSAMKVLPPLLKFCLKEIQRRNKLVELETKDNFVTEQHTMQTDAPDVDELTSILQRTENHMLATRLLLVSWHISESKSEALSASATALCRKILTYRDIDTGLAVAGLGMLPFDNMIKEIKAAVPSIQSDFSRLRTVALIGEELARMWNQEPLLMVFQSLQTNARWWHILSSHGVKIDARSFQDADSQRREASMLALVPSLLQHTNLDLELACDFCQQFNLAPEIAIVGYIEHLLLLPPQPTRTWSRLIQRASMGMQEKILIDAFRKMLMQIHPLDYEKIHFACNLMANALNEECNDIDDMLPKLSNSDDNGDDDDDDDFDEEEKRFGSHEVYNKRRLHNSDTGPLAEMKNYLNYSEIVSFLTVIHFSSEVLLNIFHICHHYANVSEIYKSRVPFWPLLEDPWSIVEPLMLADPDAATKLSPLCSLLHIEKDEFYSRSIMSSYTRIMDPLSTPSKLHPGFSVSPSVAERALQVVKNSIDLILKPASKVEVWRWVFEKESGRNNEIAISALNEALIVLERVAQRNSTNKCGEYDTFDETNCMLAELQMELIKMKCRTCVDDIGSLFNTAHSIYLPLTELLQLLSNPTDMLQRIFEDVFECSWSYQLSQSSYFAEILCSSDMLSRPLFPSLETLLKSFGASITILCENCKSLSQSKTATVSSTEEWDSKDSDLERFVRTAILSKLLADVDPLVDSSANDPVYTVNAFDSSTAIKNKRGVGTFAACRNSRNSNSSTVALTESEHRRREDIYLGFSIAVVIVSTSNYKTRIEYVQQVYNVLDDNNAGATRKLTHTARSKFRAAQSLLFLRNMDFSNSEIVTLSDVISCNVVELSRKHKYFYCLSELKETRLLCSDEALGDALGVNLHPHFSLTDCDPVPLVKTWIHDEGDVVEAMELARDVLISAPIRYTHTWVTLLDTMIHQGQTRSVIQTLVVLMQTNVLGLVINASADLCERTCQIVMNFILDIADKAEMSLEIVRHKKIEVELQGHYTNNIASSTTSAVNQSHVLSNSLTAFELNRSTFLTRTQAHKEAIADLQSKQSVSSNSKAMPSCRVHLCNKCDYSGHEWEEPPEELALNFRQASRLWSYLSTEMDSRVRLYQSSNGKGADGSCSTTVIAKQLRDEQLKVCMQLLKICTESSWLVDNSSTELVTSNASNLRLFQSSSQLAYLKRDTVEAMIWSSSTQLLVDMVLQVFGNCKRDMEFTGHESVSTGVIAVQPAKAFQSMVAAAFNLLNSVSLTSVTTSPLNDRIITNTSRSLVVIGEIYTKFNSCFNQFQSVVHNGLTKLFTSDKSFDGNQDMCSNHLAALLHLSASNWTNDEDKHAAALTLFSWCLDQLNQRVSECVNQDVAIPGEGRIHGRTIVMLALQSLTRDTVKRLRKATESLLVALPAEDIKTLTELLASASTSAGSGKSNSYTTSAI